MYDTHPFVTRHPSPPSKQQQTRAEALSVRGIYGQKWVNLIPYGFYGFPAVYRVQQYPVLQYCFTPFPHRQIWPQGAMSLAKISPPPGPGLFSLSFFFRQVCPVHRVFGFTLYTRKWPEIYGLFDERPTRHTDTFTRTLLYAAPGNLAQCTYMLSITLSSLINPLTHG